MIRDLEAGERLPLLHPREESCCPRITTRRVVGGLVYLAGLASDVALPIIFGIDKTTANALSTAISVLGYGIAVTENQSNSEAFCNITVGTLAAALVTSNVSGKVSEIGASSLGFFVGSMTTATASCCGWFSGVN